MSERVMTKEEWDGWLLLPETQQVLRTLPRRKVERLKDEWANGAYTHGSLEMDGLKNAAAIGECNAWLALSELDYDDLVAELGEDDGIKDGMGRDED